MNQTAAKSAPATVANVLEFLEDAAAGGIWPKWPPNL